MQFGIIDEPLLWLSDPNLAMPAVIIISVWKSVGFSDGCLSRRIAIDPGGLLRRGQDRRRGAHGRV